MNARAPRTKTGGRSSRRFHHIRSSSEAPATPPPGNTPEPDKSLIAYLRRRGPGGRPLFLLTRSSSILDLAAVGAVEAIIFCPANHSPPTLVAAHPGAPGYEAVATCLASPEVRARTEGIIALRPRVA